MRSALTSLGVIIGIAAVIVMVSVGQGTQQEIDKMVSGLGSQRLDISPGARRGGGGVRMSSSSFFTLNEGDVDAIRNEIPECSTSPARCAAARRWSTPRTTRPPAGGACRRILRHQRLDDRQRAGLRAQDYTSAGESIIGETVRRTLFGDDTGVEQTIRLGRVPLKKKHRRGHASPKKGQGRFRPRTRTTW